MSYHCENCNGHAPSDAPESWPTQHHAICPARPIAVGDRVRAELYGVYRDGGGWAEGDVLAVRREGGEPSLTIRFTAVGADRHQPFKVGETSQIIAKSFRRIQRPGAEQATWERVSPHTPAPYWCCQGDCPDGGQCRMVLRGARPGVLLCPEHASEAPATPPAPALVDGLTPNDCWSRWQQNRDRIEYGEPLKFEMTPDQIDSAKRHDQFAEDLRSWSAALRSKVAAAREQERCVVTYSELDADD